MIATLFEIVNAAFEGRAAGVAALALQRATRTRPGQNICCGFRVTGCEPAR